MAQGVAGSQHLYDAFVSYSHAADNELAPVLQQHMQRFAKPWYKLRSLRIFRDDTTLVLTPHLWPDIRNALDASRFFVLLASPQAAQSRWVQQELSHWITSRGAGTLLIVLTDGKIEWDDEANDFDWSLTNALPPVLKGAFSAEPKWEDVAALTKPEDLSMQNPVLRKTVASLYSAVTGRPLDAVIGEDVLQFRRTRIVAFSTLAVIIAGSGTFAWREFETAREQEREQQQREQLRTDKLTLQSLYVAERSRQLTQRGDAGMAINMVLEDIEPGGTDEGPPVSVPELHFALYAALNSNLEQAVMSTQGEAKSVAISATGQVLAAAERNVLIFDPASRIPKIRLAHEGAVTAAAFTRDGTRAVSASRDRKARIWELATRKAQAFEHGDEVLAAQLDPDEKLLATASRDDTAVIWDVATGQRRLTLPHEADVADVAWLDGSSRLITITDRGMLRAWDAASGSKLFEVSAGPNVRLRRVHVNRDGTRAVTVAARGPSVLWNTKDGSVVALLAHGKSNITSAMFSPADDLVVTTGGDQRAVVWETDKGLPVYAVLDHINVVAGATFSPEGSRLLTWSPDKSARVYAACDGRPLFTLSGHTQDVSAGGFSADGCRVVTGSGDATARLWDLVERSGQKVVAEQRCAPGLGRRGSDVCRAQTAFSEQRRALLGATFSNDGRWFATAGVDRIARVYDATTGEPVATLPEQTQPVLAVTFDASGKVLLAGYGELSAQGQPGVLRAWDWREKRELIEGGVVHTGAVKSVSYSPDGTRILTGTGDGLALILDAKSGTPILTIETPEEMLCAGKRCRISASWSPDGRRVATASYGFKACVWDIADRQGVLKDSALCVKHDHIVYTTHWNKAGTHLLTASGDQTAAVWDVRTGEAVRRFYGDAYDFRSAEFFDFDRQIVTYHDDYAVRFWHAGTGRELARLAHRQAHLTSASMDAAGQRLLTSAVDGTARISYLPATLGDLAEAARKALKRCLSVQQREQLNLNLRPLPSWCAGKLNGATVERPKPTTEAAVSVGR